MYRRTVFGSTPRGARGWASGTCRPSVVGREDALQDLDRLPDQRHTIVDPLAGILLGAFVKRRHVVGAPHALPTSAGAVTSAVGLSECSLCSLPAGMPSIRPQ